jgi:isopentenyl diphosphate isomerase/L-lactate dehydrogenase-like FMN-dependent dehydrogenase
MIIQEVRGAVGKQLTLIVDGGIADGFDAFKALALGAAGVCIGRPLMAAYKKDPENGVRDYLLKARDELAKAMAYTGCSDLGRMDASVIRRI